LYPTQGTWTEDAYLELDTNRLIEFKNGCLEFLPMPTPLHQAIVLFLCRVLDDFARARRLGSVFPAPLRTRTIPGILRQPDVVYVARGRIRDRKRPIPQADLAMEVVSEGEQNRKRDLVEKRSEYARAGIAEYWIVDPQLRTITVLTLDRRRKRYRVHGVFSAGQTATSVLLPGLTVDVTACFREGEEG
jgi:Uma2 family endonuclease